MNAWGVTIWNVNESSNCVFPLLKCLFGLGAAAALRWLPWWPLIDWWHPPALSFCYTPNATLWLLCPPRRVLPQSACVGGCRVTLVAFVHPEWLGTTSWHNSMVQLLPHVWLGDKSFFEKADSKPHPGVNICPMLICYLHFLLTTPDRRGSKTFKLLYVFLKGSNLARNLFRRWGGQ